MILTIRTDKPEAELGIYDGNKKLAYETWQAHRQLAESMHTQIAKILQFVGKELSEIDGIVVFQGPGSFTGLRIGISVANALSYSLQAPIVGTSGDDWILTGITQLKDATISTLVVPRYGSEARITAQKK
jgi:tRNA threonylcarbamoyladenosine biosynthesis protein TsaB